MPGKNKEKDPTEEAFVAAVELILDFPLMDWHKTQLLEVRTATMENRPIMLTAITKPRSF